MNNLSEENVEKAINILQLISSVFFKLRILKTKQKNFSDYSVDIYLVI